MVGNLLVTAIALHGPEVSAARHSDKQRRGTQIGKKKKKPCLGEESQEKPKEEMKAVHSLRVQVLFCEEPAHELASRSQHEEPPGC